MAKEVAAVIGSGTVSQTYAIIPPSERGILDLTTNKGPGKQRTGTQVMIGNPEDLNSVAAFAVSGITVGTTPVEILSPGSNPLPRMRTVILRNIGTSDAFIGHSNNVDLPIEGLRLTAPAGNNTETDIRLPFLHNVSIWAATSTGMADIRMLIF